MLIDGKRFRLRNTAPPKGGGVLYWMQRDQRVEDNWALLYAQECAKNAQVPLLVLFNLVPQFGNTTLRHYDFMFKGLQEVEAELLSRNIPFILTEGIPTETIPHFVREQNIGHVVTDFNPLHFTNQWREKVGNSIAVRLTEVDAHNIIPSWVASEKEEFAAYTFRPKVHRVLPEFLTPFPSVTNQASFSLLAIPKIDWEKLLASRETHREVLPVPWIVPGAHAANKNLKDFCSQRLQKYAALRNDPNTNYLSHLSPYLHFGQLSAQRVALAVQHADAERESKDAYLEELIVRRELADNFCLYNKNYDKVAGAHAWAQKTIAEHVSDIREFIYTPDEFEKAQTHDELWNAAQLQMAKEGKMHGFMRMYWAKKILEWSPDVQTAIDIALYLNDKYELDGTDPNGVVGVMWSICGVHDRAWTERSIFGKVRYMNYSGCKRKFDVQAYIDRYTSSSTLF